jgi:hypothetical protein
VRGEDQPQPLFPAIAVEFGEDELVERQQQALFTDSAGGNTGPKKRMSAAGRAATSAGPDTDQDSDPPN